MPINRSMYSPPERIMNFRLESATWKKKYFLVYWVSGSISILSTFCSSKLCEVLCSSFDDIAPFTVSEDSIDQFFIFFTSFAIRANHWLPASHYTSLRVKEI